jgi:cysteine desulfurase
LGVAAQSAAEHWYTNQQHMELMRTRLLHQLLHLLGGSNSSTTTANVRVHGPTKVEHRLPNTLSIGFGHGVDSTKLLSELRNVVAASAGATCHSTSDQGPVHISTVLRAMHIPEDWAKGTIRLSVGPSTTAKEIDQAAIHIANAVRRQWDEMKVTIE